MRKQQNTHTENPQGGGSVPKKRKIKLPENSCLNKKIIRELDLMLEFIPPRELSHHLRNVFIHFVRHTHKEGFSTDFNGTVDSFWFLFNFLELAEDEMKGK